MAFDIGLSLHGEVLAHVSCLAKSFDGPLVHRLYCVAEGNECTADTY